MRGPLSLICRQHDAHRVKDRCLVPDRVGILRCPSHLYNPVNPSFKNAFPSQSQLLPHEQVEDLRLYKMGVNPKISKRIFQTCLDGFEKEYQSRNRDEKALHLRAQAILESIFRELRTVILDNRRDEIMGNVSFYIYLSRCDCQNQCSPTAENSRCSETFSRFTKGRCTTIRLQHLRIFLRSESDLRLSIKSRSRE
jgi:hypothetical protein